MPPVASTGNTVAPNQPAGIPDAQQQTPNADRINELMGRVRRGDQSNDVRELQQLLGIPDDGIFGRQTQQAINAYQARADLHDPRVRAFLNTIASFESSNRYNVRYDASRTGATFDDFSRHPNVAVPLGDGRVTTAAGAYQITNTTWNTVGVGQLGLTDFTPLSQDLAAAQLLRNAGATQALLNNDINTAIMRAGGTAAAPGTWEALRVNTVTSIVNRYNSSLGR